MELLIVVVIIAILAAVTVAAYNGMQYRARDSRRAQDINQIKKALLMYDSENGGVKRVASYGGNGPGGWNISAGANWLTFLGTTYGSMPVDPVNTGTSDPGSGYELTYFYYCYNAGDGPMPATANVSLGYYTELNKQQIITRFAVTSCLS